MCWKSDISWDSWNPRRYLFSFISVTAPFLIFVSLFCKDLLHYLAGLHFSCAKSKDSVKSVVWILLLLGLMAYQSLLGHLIPQISVFDESSLLADSLLIQAYYYFFRSFFSKSCNVFYLILLIYFSFLYCSFHYIMTFDSQLVWIL